ncbi:MAG: protein kinase [Planctomycetaceae bacterium]|nr:protein kinase [Planctomycetaceae bacterium]
MNDKRTDEHSDEQLDQYDDKTVEIEPGEITSGDGNQTVVLPDELSAGAQSPTVTIEDQAGSQTISEDPHATVERDPLATVELPDDGGATLQDLNLEESAGDPNQQTIVDLDQSDDPHSTFISDEQEDQTLDGTQTVALDAGQDPARTLMTDEAGDSADFELSKTWGAEALQATDPGMTIRVESLDEPVHSGEHAIPRRNMNRPGSRISGPEYELLNILGEGGMGVVWNACQLSIDRNVAIKMIKPAVASKPRQVEKFIAEAVVTGDLDHPNIVPIHDLGQDDEGNFFYAMKHVQGTPWNKVIRQQSLHQNLDALLRTCDAIAFAHARGIIHRDLKPENIMLGEYGEVLVMDWGLALPTEQFHKKDSISSAHGMGGTPAYMAPEMASGPMDRIGYPSDVYLLGSILFEIVTGAPPHRGKTSQQCLFAAMRNEISPLKTNTELTAIAMKALATDPRQRYQTVKAFQSAIRDYLEHEKSLTLSERAAHELKRARETGDYAHYARSLFGYEEALGLWDENEAAQTGLKSARHTYASAALEKEDFDLAESLIESAAEEEQTLLGQIRLAKQERVRRQRMLKFAKGAVIALAAAIFVIVGTSTYLINIEYQKAVRAEKDALDQKQIAEGERNEARRQEGIAKVEKQRADDNLVLAEAARKEAVKREKEATEQRRIAVEQRSIAEDERAIARAAEKAEQYKSYVASIGLAAAKVEENAFADALHLLLECPPELRHWEWGRLMYLCSQSTQQFDCAAPVDGIALSPDNSRLAAASWDGKCQIWDLNTGKVIHTLSHDGIYVHSVDWSETGQVVATGCNDQGANLKLWDAEHGTLLAAVPAHEDAVIGVRFSSDGRWLATCSYDNTARVWDLASPESPRLFCTLEGHHWWVWDAAFCPEFQPEVDGKNQMVTVSQDGKAIVWKVAPNQDPEVIIEYVAHEGPVYSVDYHQENSTIATAGYDRTVQLWDPVKIEPFDFAAAIQGETLQQQAGMKLTGHTGPIRSVRFSPDSGLLISGSQDNSVKVWDAKSGAPIKTFRGHDSAVRGCIMTRDLRSVLSCSEDHLVIRWSVDEYAEIQTLNGQELDGHRDAILSARFSATGDSILSTSRDRSARLWDVASGKILQDFREGHQYLSSRGVFLDENRVIITSAADDSVRFWNTSTGNEILHLPRTGRSGLLQVSPDETLLATGNQSDQINIWQIARPIEPEAVALKWQLTGHQHPVTAIQFLPESNQLVSGDANGRIILWDLKTGEVIWSKRHHTMKITQIALATEPARILTASLDKTIGVVDLETGEEETDRVLKREGTIHALQFSPGLKQVVAVSSFGSPNAETPSSLLTVWNWGTAEPVAEYSFENLGINDLSLNPSAPVCYATCSDNTIKSINLTNGTSSPFLSGSQHGGLLWSSTLTADGNALLTVGGVDAHLWDVRTRQEWMSYGPHGAVASAAISPDGSRVYTGSWDRSLKIWNVQEGGSIKRVADAHEGYINCVDISHDGKRLLTAGDDGTAHVWDTSSMERLLTLHLEKTSIDVARFSPDDQSILTASSDRLIRLYDANSGELQKTFPEVHQWAILAAQFSPDGARIITGSEDHQAILWDVAQGQPVAQLNGHTAAVTSVAFSRDGKRILTGSRDNLAKLWDATSGNEGNEILTLKRHQQEVTAVDFSPTMQSLLTSSRDGTAVLWPAINWQPKQEEPVQLTP